MPYKPYDPDNPPPARAAPPSAAAPSGGYKPYDPDATPGTQAQTTGGQTPPGQSGPSLWDWSTVAGNESMMNLPSVLGLRAQVEAARQRLGPIAAASADVAGSAGSPTTAAYAIPWVGPGIAGGVHEGVKSATNWSPGESWSDYLKRVGEDTATGAAAGYLGTGAAKALPYVAPTLIRAGMDLGPAAATATYAHKLFGEPSRDILGALGAYTMFHKAGEKLAEGAGDFASWPSTQQAIKNLTLGGNSALRASSPGPLWNQWVPGQ